MERRLAAILVADVAGFSRLAEADEEATLADLTRLRADVVDPAIASHGGRVFKTTGDGLLASFPSVVEAVRCAALIQGPPEGPDARQRSLTLRIGVHVGDVVVHGDDLLGDGVNVAARLEQLARPGGVCVSGAVHEHVRDRLPQLAFRDGGRQVLRNLARPVQVWHLDPHAEGEGTGPAPASRAALAAHARSMAVDRASLAVLPFANLSGDPGQDYFSDGITEEITTALARYKSLVVIAPSASFALRGCEGDPRRVGAELGAEFLLQGSLRRSGERVRVTAQLAEAATGAQLWAERFDRTLLDLLDVQDEIAGRIVAAVAPQIREAEIARARQPGRTFSRSYDLALQAQALSEEARRASDPERIRHALSLARDATLTQPPSPHAFQVLALASIRAADLAYFSSGEMTQALRDAQAAAERLSEMEPANHMAYLLQGHVAIHARRGDEAMRLLQRSLDLNPNDPMVATMLSWAESNAGLGEAAIVHAKDALLRTPLGRDRRMMLWALALAYWVAGDPASALPYARDAVAGRRSFVQRYGVLIACLAELGELAEARALLADAEAVAPGYVKSRLEGKSWFTRPELAARYANALRKAAGLEPT